MNKAVSDIFTKASRNAVAKGRNVLKLKKLYEKYNPVRFREAFLHCCLSLIKHEHKKINPQAERCLQFAAEFCGNCYNSEEADEVDQFVVDIIDNLLLYHNNFETNLRFYVCKIIHLIIDRISANLRDDVCDRIQIAMFERMNDPSPAVREQAALAVTRLQRPEISDCAVINKYIDRITSEPNATVRKVIVQKVAMTSRTLPVIFQSISNVDAAVRSAAYLRCSSQEPSILEIEQRQYLIMQIAFDENVPNRAILERRLWPKWLDMCRVANHKAASKSSSECSDSTSATISPEKAQISPVEKDTVDACLMMLRMLRLDESVDQLQQTYTTFKVVLKVHFKLTPITDLIQALRLDSKKLVPMDEITLESVFYWKYLLRHLQRPETSQDSDEIVAELAGFCEYIDKYIETTFMNTSSRPYDEFTWLPNQHILLHLLEMVACSDLHDDFGRERLEQLLSNILKNLTRIHEDVMTIIVQIYSRIERKFETVCDYFFDIITDIMRPYKVIPLDDNIKKERDFTLAKLRFTLAMAEDTHTAAIEAKDYLRAGECHTEIISLRDKISAVSNDAQLLAEHEEQQRLQQQNGRKLREAPTTDPDKQLRCCEMLCVIIKLCYRHSYKIPPILYTAKIELLDILLEVKDNELFAKALDTLTYYGLMDKDIAEEAIVIMSSPIITYRLLPQFNVTTLTTALTGFTYILLRYGIEILNNHVTNGNENTSNDKQLSQASNCSRIERVNRVEDLQLLDLDLENISVEDYQAIILEMLDDGNLTISIHAAICITTLLQHNIAANSAVISKILLKWFTPELYKSNPKLLYILSVGISRFGETRITNIGTIMEEAAMCTLRCIIEAPAESSLYACDLPKCLQFLASVTMMAEPNKSEIHRNLALKIIPFLSSDIDIRSKEIYSKFLSYMDAPLFDVDAVRRFDELLQNTETNGLKTVRASITKYLSKLRNINNGNTTDTMATSTQAIISITSGSVSTTAHLLPSIINGQTEMHESKIDEVNSPPPIPSLTNGTGNSIPLCSTPIYRSRIDEQRLDSHTTTDKRGSISYIYDNGTYSQVSEVVGRFDVQNHVSNEISQVDADIGICTMDLERNPNNVGVSGKTKENNSNDIPSQRRRCSASNKRLYNIENEYSAQGSDADPPNQKHSCPQKKQKLSMRLNLSRSQNNKNDTIHYDTVCTDLVQMQIQSSSSSQGSTTSVSSKKRGRPSNQERENYIAQTEGDCNRLSGRFNSKSDFDNCRVVITVDAQIHQSMKGHTQSDSDTGPSISRPSCQQPRKRLRLLSRSRSDYRIQNNGQTVTRNGRTNRLKSKLQSIENDYDAIDIVTASSSSE